MITTYLIIVRGKVKLMNKETIIYAAIICDDGTIFTGKRHYDCIICAMYVNKKQSHIDSASQGFVTSMYRYVSRSEASDIAFLAGQIKYPISILTSEDLW